MCVCFQKFPIPVSTECLMNKIQSQYINQIFRNEKTNFFFHGKKQVGKFTGMEKENLSELAHMVLTPGSQLS